MRFFTEFEFNKDQEQYWFPILINTKSEIEAVSRKGKLLDILAQGFTNLKTYKLALYHKPHYSEALKPHVIAQSRAEILKLNLRKLQLLNLEGDKDTGFNQHIVVVPQNLIMVYTHTFQFHLNNLSLLTTLFHSDIDFHKDFLELRIY